MNSATASRRPFMTSAKRRFLLLFQLPCAIFERLGAEASSVGSQLTEPNSHLSPANFALKDRCETGLWFVQGRGPCNKAIGTRAPRACRNSRSPTLGRQSAHARRPSTQQLMLQPGEQSQGGKSGAPTYLSKSRPSTKLMRSSASSSSNLSFS